MFKDYIGDQCPYIVFGGETTPTRRVPPVADGGTPGTMPVPGLLRIHIVNKESRTKTTASQSCGVLNVGLPSWRTTTTIRWKEVWQNENRSNISLVSRQMSRDFGHLMLAVYSAPLTSVPGATVPSSSSRVGKTGRSGRCPRMCRPTHSGVEIIIKINT